VNQILKFADSIFFWVIYGDKKIVNITSFYFLNCNFDAPQKMMTCQMNNVNVFCLAMLDIFVGGRMSKSSNENEGPLLIYSIHPI
jgi:hypothetical protein